MPEEVKITFRKPAPGSRVLSFAAGMPGILDVGKITRMRWKPRVSLKEGIEMAYKDFLKGKVRM